MHKTRQEFFVTYIIFISYWKLENRQVRKRKRISISILWLQTTKYALTKNYPLCELAENPTSISNSYSVPNPRNISKETKRLTRKRLSFRSFYQHNIIRLLTRGKRSRSEEYIVEILLEYISTIFPCSREFLCYIINKSISFTLLGIHIAFLQPISYCNSFLVKMREKQFDQQLFIIFNNICWFNSEPCLSPPSIQTMQSFPHRNPDQYEVTNKQSSICGLRTSDLIWRSICPEFEQARKPEFLHEYRCP